MIDMRKTTVPKSDQLNADDLLGQTLTIKVTKVSLLATPDQPIAIGFEGDNEKPYKPGKSMRRVMVNAWGPDGNAYIGRSMTLYRDEKVLFGGLAVGGIRISHLSHIDEPITMALTATRAQRKPFTVKPLVVTASTASIDRTDSDLVAEGVIAAGNAFASDGKAAFTKFWNSLPREQRDAAGGKVQRDLWLAIAAKADEAPAPDDNDDLPSHSDGERASDLTPSEAADDAQASFETGAGGPSGDPAPDPQESRTAEASTGIGASAAAAQQGPQTGGEVSPKASPPATSTTAADEARKARVAEIKRDGQLAAQDGQTSLMNFLEGLRPNGEADFVSRIVKDQWREIAKAADAVKAGSRK
jgi:hypothetical protein